ncbi:hypothetical protein Tco_0756251 [Tanacetum coccineum]
MDAMRRAKKMFKDEHKGRPSAQEPSWETLRVCPKWDAPYPVPILTVNAEGMSRGNYGNYKGGGGEGFEGSKRTSRCYQAKGSKVEEKLVHLKMVVKFEVLIEKKKMYSLGLMRFDWWMEFLMVHLEELEMKKLL